MEEETTGVNVDGSEGLLRYGSYSISDSVSLKLQSCKRKNGEI
jgi:hypothetical protein